MPGFTLYPTAQGAYDTWDIYNGSTKWGNLGDGNDGTGITTFDDGEVDSYAMQDLPAEADGVNGAVSWNARVFGPAPNAVGGALFRYAGSDAFTAGLFLFTNPTQLVTVAYTNQPGGSGWAVAAVNGSEIGIRRESATGTAAACFELYASGVYVTGGTMVHLWRSPAMALLLGAAIQLSEMPAIARAASLAPRPARIGRSLILPSEYEQALRDWRAYRHPRFFLPYRIAAATRVASAA